MNQFDQLLTCAICLDRYRNPKLLPCQHSFCMEPCMEGLVDYVRRQVKCPECRAETRIPYNGVQAFPTNVTLTRFLELHIELTGEIPDPTTNQIMERCQVCSEKAYCLLCAHCDKKVCSECKEAHMDVLKREITRISNQVRRVLHRLEDSIGLAEKNTLLIQQNSLSVIEEIDEIYRRLAKALKDRTEFMKHEVERYLQTELKNLTILKYNMEQEVGNIVSNCDLVDKYVSPESTGATTQWDDVELMDTKDIFLRTMEFIRAFEYEPGDYARRVRFSMNQDPNNLAVTLGTFGDLHLPSSGTLSLGQANVNTLSVHSQAGSQSGLMRSKSDHRLTSQYRGADYDVESSGRTSPVFGRKFGERDQKKQHKESNPYPEMEHMEVPSTDRKSRFRSRFTRNLVDSFDDSGEGQGSSGRGVRFNENETKKERERVLDTEDVARGPLSGITRLLDSPRVIQRVQEADAGPKPVKPAPTPVAVAPVAVAPAPVAPWRTTSRQVSEEDEITKQKKANKMEAAAAAKPAAVQPPPRRQASTEPRTVTERTSSSRNPSESTAAEPSIDAVQTAVDVVPTNSAAETTARLRNKLSPERYPAPKKNRSESSDSGTSETSSGSSPARTGTGTTATGTRVAPPTTPPTPASASSTAARPNFQSRFLGRTQTPKTSIESKKEESSSSEEEDEEEESDDDDEDEESDEEVVPAVEEKKPEKLSRMEKTDIGPLLARSAHEREQRNLGSRQNSTSNASATSYTKKESPPNTVASYRRTRDAVTRVTSPPEREIGSRYGTQSGSSASNPSSTYSSGRYNTRTGSTDYSPAGASLARSRSTVYSTPTEDPVTPSRYSSSSSSSGLANKYLNRSRHTFDDDTTPSSRYGSSVTPSSSSAYSRPSYLSKHEEQQASVGGSSSRRLPKDKKTKVSKSKSSHDVLAGIGRSQSHDEDAVYLPQSSRSQRRRKASLNPDKDFQPGDDESNSSLSSWARYLKTKYGKGSTKSFDGGAGASASEEHASTASELRPKRASFSQPSAAQYMGKSRVQLKFGSRGSEPGKLTWPRGICCTENGPDGSTQIVVADSTNHRICVFDSNGTFLKEFGSYGSGDGEFDCPGAVWVNRIGQFIVSDRYNHRVQVFDPSGRFLRSFGSQGETPGKFSYPLGVTTDALNFIYVCEESRIQVFQSDGTFVGKFGSLGSKVGEISHPHYIAITSTNKIIVSDTNNSRIQIFDINGKVLSCIGGEGSDEGLLKAPRGVAVDESGYIIVADSGNNRIQIFSPDGVFLKSFGSWAGDSQEFKGLEGLAVANGNIYAVDRVNHCVIVL